MPKKRLLELRDARVQRLLDEQRSLEQQQKEQERQMIHEQIMQK